MTPFSFYPSRRGVLLGCAVALLCGAGWLGGKMSDPVLLNTDVMRVMANRLGHGDAVTLDFKQMSKVHLEKGTDIVFPDSLKKLDGKQVALTGFMAPYDEIDNMSNCLIMASGAGCFFCQPPSLDQVAFIMQKKQASKRPYLGGPVVTIGTLRLFHDGSTHPGHLAEFLYVIDEAEVHSLKDSPESPAQAPGHTKDTAPTPQTPAIH